LNALSCDYMVHCCVSVVLDTKLEFD
jgi:hypothetical protein